MINKRGSKPDIDKVEVIRAHDGGQVRGFVGAIGYRRFKPVFLQLAGPLLPLTRKYARFKLTEDCRRAFDCLKEHLTVIPRLTNPNLSKPMVLYTDVSDP